MTRQARSSLPTRPCWTGWWHCREGAADPGDQRFDAADQVELRAWLMLNTQRIGGVQVAALSRAPVNAIDGALIERLDQLLGALSADPQISVLLIRSDQK